MRPPNRFRRARLWPTRQRGFTLIELLVVIAIIAILGDAGEFSLTGVNKNNPAYLQFFNLTSIPEPTNIFVFLDEHPDSINDGYFVNRAYTTNWFDLPASYHNGAASFSFADGHAATHQWRNALTKQPPRPNSDVPLLPLAFPKSENQDHEWVIEHMSVEKD